MGDKKYTKNFSLETRREVTTLKDNIKMDLSKQGEGCGLDTHG
jgi:hypothetical protein